MTDWDEWTAAWRSATHLYAHLASGGTPQPLFTPVRLQPGETSFCDLTVMYSRFYGMDVSYQQNSGFFFGSPLFVAAGLAANAVGNSVARNRAEAMAAPQWREHCLARTVVTDRRTLCFTGQQWLAFDHDAVVEFTADPPRGVCFLNFSGAEPLCLAGFGTPWLSVLLCYFLYGSAGLPQLPYLRQLAAGPV
ncbi:MAG: hypothetical protein ABWY11_26260 [Umezawaea sp.]